MNIGVVGAGIFGIAAALELRGRGHRVTLFDQGSIPYDKASSTDVAKAIRRTYYGDNHTYVELVERSARKWRQWQAGFDSPVYHQTGAIKITRDFEPMLESFRYLKSRGAQIEMLSPEEASERFPQFSFEDGETIIYEPWNGYLEAGRAVGHLAQMALVEGVEVRERSPVSRIEESTAGVWAVLDEESIEFDRVIVATGVWLGRLLPELTKDLEVTHQQMVFIDVEDKALFRPGVMPGWGFGPHADMWYGFPLLREGYVKVSNDQVGQPVEPDADRQLTQEFVDWTMEFLQSRIPEMAKGRVVGGRSCLFTVTPDDHFIIDWAPGSDRVLVAGGGSSHGFKFGGSIGEVIADALEDRHNPLGDLFRIGGRLEKGRRPRQKADTPGFALSGESPAGGTEADSPQTTCESRGCWASPVFDDSTDSRYS